MAFMREAGCEVEAVVVKSDSQPRVDESCRGDRKAEGCDRTTGDGRGKQPCALEQEQRIHREDDPERAGAGEDVEEQSGGQVEREAGCGAQDMAVACRDGEMGDVEGDVGADGKTGYERC